MGLKSANYDRRTAGGSDTSSLFDGWYSRKTPPKAALDDLVPAFRKHLDVFLQRLKDETKAGEAMAGRSMVIDGRELHKLIMQHLLSNYGMERSLAQGFADQIVKGENY